MSNILLVEPDYGSKFPPLGLMKLSSWHKQCGDQVNFVRGCDREKKNFHWHRIYISSLFTWELPRTVKTIKYYQQSVLSSKDIFVGGIGATLLPDYIREQVDCTIIEGQIEQPGILGPNSPPIAEMVPDYDLIQSVDYSYTPENAYFLRITKGCVRSCKFCAVPQLEKEFGYLSDIKDQVKRTNNEFGEKQHMVIMDNNVLALKDIEDRIKDIRSLGFERGAKRNGRMMTVDFNQGIDARLIAKKPILAKLLGTLPLKPIRLAFDFVSKSMERDYRTSIKLLVDQGFGSFTNYMLYNFKDTPTDFYYRLRINAELNNQLGIRVSGFPMRYIPPTETQRGYVSPNWNWRYLRGIQCVLQATHGLVSPRTEFMHAAFGESQEEFEEILSMPDRYILFREHFKHNGASDGWRKQFRMLSRSERGDFLTLLGTLHADRKRKDAIKGIKKFRDLLEHYYPGGNSPPAITGAP
ncbi:MAG: cobalamin-binding domain-containing protein [Geobacter sp.]|nr:MAG: cobalamin-binding domain-containing protein [Geobacter sp.]